MPDPDSEMGIKILHPNNLYGQMQVALENIDAVLTEAGMTSKINLTLHFSATGFSKTTTCTPTGFQPPTSCHYRRCSWCSGNRIHTRHSSTDI